MAKLAPKNGEYLDGKCWFARKGGIVTLGLTSSALEDLGSVESVELPSEGDDFDKGDVAVTLEGTQGRFELTTPAAGLVQEVNDTVLREPERVTEDPLEEGWLIRLEIQDPSDLKEYAQDDED